MRYIPTPESLFDLDVHLRNFHGTLVYNHGSYEAEHNEQHTLAARGALGEHAEFWKPHTHVVTKDSYQWAWSTAYWAARDEGYSRTDALDRADTATEQMLDALEES